MNQHLERRQMMDVLEYYTKNSEFVFSFSPFNRQGVITKSLRVNGEKPNSTKTFLTKCPSCGRDLVKSFRTVQSEIRKESISPCPSCITKQNMTTEIAKKISDSVRSKMQEPETRQKYKASRSCMKRNDVREKLSQATKLLFENKEYRERHKQGQILRWDDPSARARRSEISKKLMTEELRKQIGDSLTKFYIEHPEHIDHLSKMTKDWISNNGTQNCSKGGKINWTKNFNLMMEQAKKNGLLLKEKWKDPVFRQKIQSSIRKIRKGSNGHRELFSLISKDRPDAAFEYNHSNEYGYYALDIYIPSLNLDIEYCGDYWHKGLQDESNLEHLQSLAFSNDLRRFAGMIHDGITIIHVFESHWKRNKTSIVNEIQKLINDMALEEEQHRHLAQSPETNHPHQLQLLFSTEFGQIVSLAKDGPEYKRLLRLP